MRKEKTFIIKLADFFRRYFGASKRAEEEIHNLHERAKTHNEELEFYKSNNNDLFNQLEISKRKLDDLTIALQKKNKTIDNLICQLSHVTTQCNKLQEQNTSLKKENDKLTNLHNQVIGFIISGIQNSEIFDDNTFSKEQVILFLNNQFEQLLSVLDIEMYEDVNIHINPMFHKIEKTQYCEDITKEGYISKSLRKGFRIGDKCIQEQLVEIYSHNK